jgi:general secretion pathway protein D
VSVFSLNLSANCENKFFTFSIKEAQGQSISIMDVIENISDECKMTVIFEDSSVKEALNKKLNYINVEDYSLKDLLDLMLTENNIFYELKNSQKILKLANFKTKTYFIDYVSFSERKSSTNKVVKTGSSGNSSSDAGDGSTTMNFVSDFKFWDKISEDIGYILHRDEDTQTIKSKVLINQEGGMLTVTGTKKQLDRVEKYVKSLMGRLHKEILIEAKIIEVIYSDSHTEGIDWSKFELSIGAQSDAGRSRGTGSTVLPVTGIDTIPAGFTNGFTKPNYLVGYNFSMQGMINFLKTQGDISIVSNPKIMTLNNQPAVINVGTEVNYRYQTESTTDLSSDSGNTAISYENDSTFVGVTLDITPQVTKNDNIILKINPIISELVDVDAQYVDENGIPVLAPDIKIKQLSSIVKVKNNNKVIIGGLIGKKDTIDDTSVPGLASIPLLGKAFQSSAKETQKGELIIVIIPHIVDGQHNPTLDELDEKYTKEIN